MAQLGIWSIGIDVALLLSLIFLCYRFMRSEESPLGTQNLHNLEGSLQRLITEADKAGRSLNDHLVRRQQSLEKLLSEIGSAEQRVNIAVATAEQNRSNQAELRRVAPVKSAKIPASPLRETIELDRNESTKSWGKVNIYGEPIGAPAPAAQENEAAPERVAIKAEAAPVKSTSQSMEDVYNAAEEMLRAGSEISAVASKTRLPVEEVQVLSNIIRREADAVPASAVDPRLGVLAGGARDFGSV